MNCPHCAATTKKRAKKTKLGYATFDAMPSFVYGGGRKKQAKKAG